MIAIGDEGTGGRIPRGTGRRFPDGAPKALRFLVGTGGRANVERVDVLGIGGSEKVVFHTGAEGKGFDDDADVLDANEERR